MGRGVWVGWIRLDRYYRHAEIYLDSDLCKSIVLDRKGGDERGEESIAPERRDG